jgi:parallel beta-helix repeat protein
MKKKLAILMMSGLFLTNVFTINAQTANYFVTESGAGSGDGSSWDNASSDLQAIISSASSGERIFVAGGTYYPTLRAGNGNSDRDKAFVLNDGVEIYGGFAGTENDLTDRDLTLTANATVLSGDLNVGGDADADAYHVVIAAGLTTATVLDGVTISGGKANANGSISNVNGETVPREDGGGIYIKNSDTYLTLSNVTFKENNARHYGGGVYNAASSTLNGITVLDNNAAYGGGIFNDNSNSDILDATVSGNTASTSGGGITNANTSTPALINVLITNNKATGDKGGGIYNTSSSDPTLTNVTISKNKAASGGGIYNNSGVSLTANNTIIWGNELNSGSSNGVGNAGGVTPAYTYSLVQGVAGGTSGNLNGTDMNLVVFTDVANDDYTLAAGSPAINAGDNTANSATHDLVGNLRRIAATIDLGAFEYSIKATNGIVYVDDDGTGDGSSWTSAYPNLAFPLAAAADNGSGISEIRVAGGTYYPLYKAGNGTGDRDRAFVLVEGVAIYGGYSGTGDERDIETNETILSGDLAAEGLASDSAYHVVIGVNVTAATILDGVTVTGGKADGSGSITVNTKAVEQSYGGGISNSNNSSPTLIKVKVTENKASNGGGIYNLSSSPKILSSSVSENTATTNGGGILNRASSPTLINVLVVKNEAASGGGIYNLASSSPTLTNVTVAENNVSGNGGGIYNNGGVPTVQNTIIWGNTRNNSSSNNVTNNSATPTYSYSLVQGIAGGTSGNLDGTISQGDVLDANYCLLKCDSTVEGGDINTYNTAVAGITGYGSTDLAGKQRVSGIQIDMGALEFQNPLSLAVENTSAITYGDSKIITLTGTSPWTITYTIGSGSEKTSTITGNPGVYGFIPDSAGTCEIVSIEDADCTRELSITFTVNKRNVTITPISDDPDTNRKTYGQDDPILSWWYNGLAGGDQFDGLLTREQGENAGKYKILPGTLTIGGNRLANYNITFVYGVEFIIEPAPAGAIKKENGFEWPTGAISGPIRLPSKTVKGVPIVYTFTPSDAATLVDYLLIPLGGEIYLTATTTDPNYVLDELHVIRVSSPSQPPIMRQVLLPKVPGVVTDPPDGQHYAISGTDYTFVLSPAEGREFEGTPVVRVSRPNNPDIIVLEATVTPNGDGTYTVTIPGVIQNIDVIIEAPVTPATGTAAISGNRVWSAGGRLYIQAVAPGEALVYAQSGALVKAIPYAAGETVTELPAGIYIIRANGKAQKVVVNR